MSIRSPRLFLLLAALAPVSLFASVQGGDQSARVIPLHGTFRGLTYGEWSAEWWQAAFATPVEGGGHPLITGAAFDGEDGIVFLSAPVAPAGFPPPRFRPRSRPGRRYCSRSSRSNVRYSSPRHSMVRTRPRSARAPTIYWISCRTCLLEIDGGPANAHRVESPLFQWGPLPADNVFGAPESTISDAVSAGYFLMLPPLNVGIHHIAVSATIEAFGLAVDAEFIITVEPRGTP